LQNKLRLIDKSDELVAAAVVSSTEHLLKDNNTVGLQSKDRGKLHVQVFQDHPDFCTWATTKIKQEQQNCRSPSLEALSEHVNEMRQNTTVSRNGSMMSCPEFVQEVKKVQNSTIVANRWKRLVISVVVAPAQVSGGE
jgi:hypothetical protein